MRVAETAAAGLPHGEAVARPQDVRALGMHHFTVDQDRPMAAVATAEEAPGRKFGAGRHAEELHVLAAIVAEGDLLAGAASRLSRAAAVGQQALLQDHRAGERFPHLRRHRAHVGGAGRDLGAVPALERAEAAGGEVNGRDPPPVAMAALEGHQVHQAAIGLRHCRHHLGQRAEDASHGEMADHVPAPGRRRR